MTASRGVVNSKGQSKVSAVQARKRQRAERRRQGRLVSVLIGLGGLLLLAGVVFVLGKGQSGARIQMAVTGQPISDLALTDLQGQTVRLSDYRGQPVLINAWATWCPPCKAEMPALQALYDDYKDEGFTLLAINAGESQAAVGRFIDQQGFNFPVLLDSNAGALQALGVNSFPTSIFVGADGVVKTIHIGMLTPEAIEAELVPLLEQN